MKVAYTSVIHVDITINSCKKLSMELIFPEDDFLIKIDQQWTNR